MAENNTTLPSLPEFPTTWSTEEEQRLKDITTQKARMEELYKTKFSPEAWAGVSNPERTIRSFVAELPGATPLIKTFTPWEWGFDYGVTPEQAIQKMREVETEYTELLRMQRVVNVLPSVQTTLRALALTQGKIVTTREELNSYFKLDTLGFTEEEQDYVVAFAKGLLKTDPEDIKSGQLWGLNPITQEEIYQLADTGGRSIISPNQILSTVAFSSDLNQIGQALKLAFPPIGGEVSAEQADQNYLQSYIDMLQSLGVNISENATSEEVLEAVGNATGNQSSLLIPTDEAGLPLVDPATNQTVVFRVDANNYTWYGEELLGYYNKDTNKVVPVDLQGNPLSDTDEFILVDLGQAAFLSLWQSAYAGKQFTMNTIPYAFASTIGAIEGTKKFEKGELIYPTEQPEFKYGITLTRTLPIWSPELQMTTAQLTNTLKNLTTATPTEVPELYNPYDNPLTRYMADLNARYNADYLARQQAYKVDITNFVKEHPEYMPRDEWDKTLSEKWHEEGLAGILNPGYMAYVMASNVNSIIASLASVGVTYATGNPGLGLATAVALFTPLEVESLKEELVSTGMTPTEANSMALFGGTLISSMESIGELPVLRALAPQFFNGVTNSFRRGLLSSVKQGLWTFGKIELTETFLEEVPQNLLHNLIVQSVDENKHLLEGIPESIYNSLVSVAPMAFLGGGADYMRMRHFLPEEITNNIDSRSQDLQEAGIPEEAAELISYNEWISTTGGEAQLFKAIEDMDAELPHSKWDTYTGQEATGMTWDEWNDTVADSSQEYTDKVNDLSSKLNSLNEDLEDIRDKKKRYTEKANRAQDDEAKQLKELIEYLTNQEAEIETQIKIIEGNLQQAKNAQDKDLTNRKVEAEPSPSAESVAEEMPEFEAKAWDNMFAASRKSLAKDAGVPLAGRKSAAELTAKEKKAIMYYLKSLASQRQVAKPKEVAKKVVPVADKDIMDWFDDLSNDEVEGMFGDNYLDIMSEAKSYEELEAKQKTAVKKEFKERFGEEVEEKAKEEVVKPTAKPIVEVPVTPVEESKSESAFMPESERIKNIELAEQALLQEADVKPNKVYSFDISEGEMLVYTDHNSKVMVMGTMHIRPETGKLTIDLVASANPKRKFGNGKAILELVSEAKKRGVVLAPKVECSEDALKIYDRIANLLLTPTKTAKVIRIFGMRYENVGNHAIAVIRQELHNYKDSLVKKVKLIKDGKVYEVSVTYDGEMTLETTHLEDIDHQVSHELAHLAYHDIYAEFQGLFTEDVKRLGDELPYAELEELFAEATEEFITGEPQDNSRMPEDIRRVPFRQTHPELVDKAVKFISDRPGLFYDQDVSDQATEMPVSPEQPAVEQPATDQASTTIKLPRATILDNDMAEDSVALRTHPEMNTKVRLSKKVAKFRADAESNWDRATDEEKATIAKKLKLGKGFIAKSWVGMSEVERRILTINAIQDGSLHFNMIREFMDMSEFMQMLEEFTDAPMFAIYQRIHNARSLAETIVGKIAQKLSSDPSFKVIMMDSAQKEIVRQELNARNTIQGVEHPDTITDSQLALVDAIQEIYDSYKTKARYLEVMREKNTLEAMKERFPDAVKEGKLAELEEVVKLRKKGDFDALWNFLKTCDWGVIDRGFDPRKIGSPKLNTRDIRMGYVRGEGSLEQRTNVEYPEGMQNMDVISTLFSYVMQMEIQWNIEPELSNLEDWWQRIRPKFSNKNEVYGALNRWWRVVQGIPASYGWFDRQLKKLQRTAYSSVFWEPSMPLRNSFQTLLMQYDKAWLIKCLTPQYKLNDYLYELGESWYKLRVGQLAGIREWMQTGREGLPGMNWLMKIAGKTSLYGLSDYIPRRHSFLAYYTQAWKATERYIKDGDIERWLRNSGAYHIRATERNLIISHYLSRGNELFDFQAPGLDKVSGFQAAALQIAETNTDHTGARYRWYQRGAMEMSPTGETIFNLFVFPRFYAQRMLSDVTMIRNVFKKEATWTEARKGFNDLLTMFTVAQIFGVIWSRIINKKRNPYDPFSILTQWTFGGLFVGGAVDLSKLLVDTATAMIPYTDEESRNAAKLRIPNELKRLNELYIPFYKRAIDIWSSIEGTNDQDSYWFREMIALTMKDYTPEKLEQLDGDLWERMRQGLLGALPAEPTYYEKLQADLQTARDRLGTLGTDGKFYTLREFGNDVANLTKDLPPILISEYSSSHPLDIFYKDCEAEWEEYYSLSTTPSSVRKNWRLAHPREEAMMLFWGKFSESVFSLGSDQWEQVASLLALWFAQFEIDQRMHPEWANWGLDLTG